MSFLQHALALADQGFHVFPLRPNSKLPLIEDFPNQATTDHEKIRSWWIDPICELEQPFNVGISTSRYGDKFALLVVDVDNKGVKKGDDEIFKLELEGKEFPPTFTQVTPTGGRHLVYLVAEAIKQGISVLGPGLDTRSKGGYIVGAGSIVGGKPYSVSDSSVIGSLPSWIYEACGKAPEKSTATVDLSKINTAAAAERAIFYLQNEAPESVKGQGGDQTAYKVACRVKDFGVDQNSCLDLMMEHWFGGSGWSAEKLQLKIQHAYKYGIEAAGAAAPENDFEPIVEKEEEFYLEKINKEYALVFLEGSHVIIREHCDEEGKPKRSFLNEQSFKRIFSPHTVQKSGTYAEVWLDWKGRREYQGVCFAPEREPGHGYYNLWRGFTCRSTPYSDGTAEQRRGLDLFLSHARENICRGNEELFTWLMGYFAHMVQRPYEKPLTTVAFHGGKGVGKNALVDRVGGLLGPGHYLVAHDQRFFTSNFNAHLDSCLCLVLDEAFWSGDKSANGKLKGLTTSPKIMIERKGKEPYTVDNFLRIFILGNEEWLVPASTDERRYAVFNVGDGRKQDTKFFTEMRVLIDEKGGRELLLHYLQTFDLSKVNVNVAPKTDALLDQKLLSLEPLDQFWYECLQRGYVSGSDWPETVSTEDTRIHFRNYCKDRNIGTRVPDSKVFGRTMRRLCKSVHTTKKRNGAETVWVYKFPPLDQARKEFSAHIGQEVSWD